MSDPVWVFTITCLGLALCVVSIVVGMRIERALSAELDDKPRRPVQTPGKPDQSVTDRMYSPFRLTLYDQSGKEIQCPPVWLEVEVACSGDHWDWLQAAEIEAKQMMFADAECNVDWDEHKANWRDKGKV